MTSRFGSSNLGARLTFSGIAIPLLFLSIYFSTIPWFQWVFVFLLGLIINGALWEFYRISASKGLRPVVGIAVVSTFAFLYALFVAIKYPAFLFAPWGIFFLILVALFAYYLFHQQAPLLNMGVTVLGLVYLTLPLSSLLAINFFFPPEHAQDGRWWLFYLLAVTKINDTAAYFGGKTWGRMPFAPKISPKKTWEGSICGLIASLLISLLFYGCMQLYSGTPPLDITLWESIWVALILGGLAQFGDLAESLFKRDTGVKDSNQLPGIGGMLDLLDSLVFTAPFFTLFLEISFG